MENKDKKKILDQVSNLPEQEKLNLFAVEQLEERLETAWNGSCETTDSGCAALNYLCWEQK